MQITTTLAFYSLFLFLLEAALMQRFFVCLLESGLSEPKGIAIVGWFLFYDPILCILKKLMFGNVSECLLIIQSGYIVLFVGMHLVFKTKKKTFNRESAKPSGS